MLSPIIPVRGDLDKTACFPLPGTGVPVRGPFMNMSGFSGDNGPVFSSTSSQRNLKPSPIPPMNFLIILESTFSTCVSFSFKLTLRIFFHPLFHSHLTEILNFSFPHPLEQLISGRFIYLSRVFCQ